MFGGGNDSVSWASWSAMSSWGFDFADRGLKYCRIEDREAASVLGSGDASFFAGVAGITAGLVFDV